ncbi:TPA: DUF2285 domain-containing protein [Pseudomonas aeruginosa]|uniref:DUF2285 domain-containing protein n=2 Tax=Pseudomonadaceae TaxID=135621 RepID=A0ABS9FUG4_9PSED|nr:MULTISPECIES: DUF2285 domain-containing protein [Pseudomonadaceae]ESQ97729.1 hypothetical protein F753_19300 [Stutzerimonas chloritidismutans AW-1]MBH8755565.1 DUF2285 domain-containing protein [Pseudomonas aeruginosa]MCF4973005.1 DUF2285 domain-containing protein [Pseudomonas lactis]MCF5003684.1 DUF2285 domain-containing protein [Pseudomonas lactis]MCF5009063.1 DUF2285 domain-containing protein [Pseudomonas lactis]
MVDHEQWYPAAAYLYVLHLDDLALAWEYLRRNPEYRRDWHNRQRRPEAAQHWGLRLLEDPDLDARDAQPAWFPDPPELIHLYPDVDPMPDSAAFDFWRISGSKGLIHDGRRLLLMARWPCCCLRLAVAPDLEQGMAYVHAVRACARPCTHYCVLAAELDKLAVAADAAPFAATLCRPSPAVLLELHTLQALDATLAGASLREVAVGLFGAAMVTGGWHADGGLRSKVRRLVRRGRTLMLGGYRRLAQLDECGEGRSAQSAKRP